MAPQGPRRDVGLRLTPRMRGAHVISLLSAMIVETEGTVTGRTSDSSVFDVVTDI